MADTTDRTLRKDAELNRQRILAAGRAVFAERGFAATLNDVAAQAGVGVGTTYRRFANKEELIDALFEDRLEELGQLAERANLDPDAWKALVAFMERTTQLMAEDRGFMEVLQNPAHGLKRVSDSRARIGPLVTSIVERAKRQGTLRHDFEATDVAMIQVALGALIDRTRAIEPGIYRRYLWMFLDGLRADRRGLSELPVAALSGETAEQAMLAPGSRHGDAQEVDALRS